MKAGTVFYTDAELTTEQGTLLMDAAVVVQEVWIRAARIAYTVKEKTEEAWVAGEDLIMLNLATPTDLDALIVNENVVLLAPAVPAEANEPAAEPVKAPVAEKPAVTGADDHEVDTAGLDLAEVDIALPDGYVDTVSRHYYRLLRVHRHTRFSQPDHEAARVHF